MPTRDANVRVAGIKVEYELLPKRHDGFMALILVQGRHRLGDWELRFRLPGATIEHIMWARWRRHGHGVVVVTGSPLPWPRSGDNQARIVIFGTGTPRWPAAASSTAVPASSAACPRIQLTRLASSASPADRSVPPPLRLAA